MYHRFCWQANVIAEGSPKPCSTECVIQIMRSVKSRDLPPAAEAMKARKAKVTAALQACQNNPKSEHLRAAAMKMRRILTSEHDLADTLDSNDVQ